MIDPISAFGALTAAHGAIKKCVEMGRDLSSASAAISKYAQAEADLGFGKARKKKSIFGGSTDDALAIHFKQEEQARLKAELRSLFKLYGSPGQWERLQATIGEVRAERKRQLEEIARKRDLIIKSSVALVVAAGGFTAIFYWVLYLKGDL